MVAKSGPVTIDDTSIMEFFFSLGNRGEFRPNDK